MATSTLYISNCWQLQNKKKSKKKIKGKKIKQENKKKGGKVLFSML